MSCLGSREISVLFPFVCLKLFVAPDTLLWRNPDCLTLCRSGRHNISNSKHFQTDKLIYVPCLSNDHSTHRNVSNLKENASCTVICSITCCHSHLYPSWYSVLSIFSIQTHQTHLPHILLDLVLHPLVALPVGLLLSGKLFFNFLHYRDFFFSEYFPCPT